MLVATQIFAGNVYYVDAINGNDNNNGISLDSAWKTISKVNNLHFFPGDSILFKRGEIWREKLIVPSSGTDGNPIIFSAYGEGDNPIINGADLITGWTNNSGNIWQATCNTEPRIVWFDGTAGNKQSSIGNVDSQYDWYWNSNVMYVYSTSDPDTTYTRPGIEATKRNYCIIADAKQYISISNIKAQYSRWNGIGLVNEQANGYCTIDSCTLYYNRSSGIVIYNGHEHNTIQNCTATYNGIAYNIHTANNNTIDSCISEHSIRYTESPTVDGHGYSLYDSDGCIVESCESNDDYTAGGLDAQDNGHSVIFRYNYFHDAQTGSYGLIFCNIGSGGTVDACYNLIINNGGDNGYGIWIEGTTAGTINIYNNVIYQDSSTGYALIRFYNTADNCIMKNNILQFDRISASAYHLFYATAGSLTSDYNCFYGPNLTYVIRDGDTKYETVAEWLAASGQDDNSVESDSQLTDPSNDDFTLQANSPCINAGIDLGLTEDYKGDTVPYGGRVDIGAYEYQGSIDPLTANINASLTSGYAPLTVDFTASASGGAFPYSYSWNFGDGSSSTDQNPSHTYFQVGTYSVTLIVTDSNSNQASDSLTITASAIPAFQLTISSVTGSPAPGEGGTTNPSPGNHSYSSGSSVQVKAIPNANYRFSKWTRDVSSSEAYTEEITITMDKDKSISANFSTQCGDVNGNLSITPADAQAAFDIFLRRISNPTDSEKENADVNCSGTETKPNITPADAQAIFDKFLGKSELPCDCSCNSRTGSVSAQMRHAPDVNLIINDIELNLGKEIFVPIIVDNPFNIKAFGFDLFFPTEILEFVGVERTKLLKDFEQVDANQIAVGLVRVGGYGSDPIRSHSPRVLITLIFKVIGEAKKPSSFDIINTVDDIKNASVKNGMIIR